LGKRRPSGKKKGVKNRARVWLKGSAVRGRIEEEIEHVPAVLSQNSSTTQEKWGATGKKKLKLKKQKGK